jgi:hypothetical protein
VLLLLQYLGEHQHLLQPAKAAAAAVAAAALSVQLLLPLLQGQLLPVQ